jgi:cyclophilin family peptidyl-prolyl cis-trans isomerase
VSAPIILAAVRPTLLALCAVLLLVGCGGNDDKPASTAAAPAAAGVTCKKVAAPAPKGEQHLSKPKTTLEPGKRYDVDLQTNCGTITIRLATGRAPKTSASFADLVKRGFYDGLTFHRVVRDFVIQGGDPLGTGMGGPGYTVVEKPPADLAYTTGIVAMAKTEADPAGASGSQFFIVTAADAGLPPDYAVAGGVVRGMDVAQHIGTLPVDDQDRPTSPVVIEKATLRTG